MVNNSILLLTSSNQSPQSYVWSEFLLFLLSLIGLGLNLYVLHIVFLRKKTSLASDNILMGLIAFFDALSCLFQLPMVPIRLFGLSKNFFLLCWSDLLIFSISTFSTLFITSILSIIRYLSLVRGWRINWKESLFISIFFLIIVWIVTIVRGGINGLKVMPSGMYCMPHKNGDTGIYLGIDIIYVFLNLPLPFIIIFCYAAVGYQYRNIVERNAKDTIRFTCSELENSPTIQYQMRELLLKFHRKRLVKLIVVIISYALSLVPEYILSIRNMFFNDSRSQIQDTISFLFMFLLAIVNPLFVLHVHEGSRDNEEMIEV